MSILSALKKKGAKGKNIEECIKTFPIGSGGSETFEITDITDKARLNSNMYMGSTTKATACKSGNLLYISVAIRITSNPGIDDLTNYYVMSIPDSEFNISEYNTMLLGVSADHDTGSSGIALISYNSLYKAMQIRATKMATNGVKYMYFICAKEN